MSLPSLDSWAHRFPSDPELPQLRAVFQPGPGSRLRCRLLRRRCDPRTTLALTYKPRRRCVVSLAQGTVLLKLFHPGLLRGVAERYAALGESSSFGALRPASPDAVCTDCSGLVWRTAGGDPLRIKLRAPEGEVLAAEVGGGLARMQRAAIPWTERHGARDEVETVARWVRAASTAFPRAAERIENTRRIHLRAAPPEAGEQLVPAHRDFHDGQILADGAALILLDLDTACHAPAELDVANFLAHLRLRELEGSGVCGRRIASAFLAGFTEVAGRDGLAPDRLRWYEAGALLRLACVYAFRPSWTPLSDRLLEEASRRLETQPLAMGDLS